jgi:hypothetical protein
MFGFNYLKLNSWSHPYMTTLTNEQVVAELKWTELAIKNIIGVSPHLFRPVKYFFFLLWKCTNY